MVPPKKQVWTLHRCAPLCTLQGVVAKLCLSYGDSYLHKENILSVKWWRRYPHAVMISRTPFHSGAGVEFKQQFSGEIIWLPLDGTRNSRGLGIPSTAFLDARTKHPLSCSRCLQTTKPVRDRMSYRREHSVWRGVKGDRGGIIRSSC